MYIFIYIFIYECYYGAFDGCICVYQNGLLDDYISEYVVFNGYTDIAKLTMQSVFKQKNSYLMILVILLLFKFAIHCTTTDINIKK